MGRPTSRRNLLIEKIVKLASEMGIPGTIAKSSKLFDQYYANPKSSSVARTLFTSDFTQIYGALLKKSTGEENYAEWKALGKAAGEAIT